MRYVVSCDTWIYSIKKNTHVDNHNPHEHGKKVSCHV